MKVQSESGFKVTTLESSQKVPKRDLVSSLNFNGRGTDASLACLSVL